MNDKPLDCVGVAAGGVGKHDFKSYDPKRPPRFSKRVDPETPLLNHGDRVTVLNELGEYLCAGVIVGRSRGGHIRDYDILTEGRRLFNIPCDRVILE